MFWDGVVRDSFVTVTWPIVFVSMLVLYKMYPISAPNILPT